MDSSSVTGRQDNGNPASTPSSRQEGRQEYTHQAVVDHINRRERQIAENKEITRRQAQSAFRDSLEQDRLWERRNMEAGVEKMVRSVVRKESAEVTQDPPERRAEQRDAETQAQYMRDKLNATYSSEELAGERQDNPQPEPSTRQQQRAINDYQQSIRHRTDHTVELVI